jgi:serine/threonine protein kinase
MCVRCAVWCHNRFTSNNKVVTRWYRSPELLLEAQKYGPEIDIWSIGCLFAELKERQATLKGNSDLHQLELVYQLCGTPLAPGASPSSGAYVAENTSTHKLPVLDGTVYNIYKELPGWEKCAISNTYPPIFTTRFCKFAPLAANLLSQMLAMNPAQRITAADALNHNYFWQSKIPRAEELPRFNDVKCGHEYEARLKRNAEHTARQREHAQLVAKQSQHFQPHYNTASRNPSYPGHQQHGFAASNPNPVAHAPANAYIRSGNPSGHGGRGSRSSQGLTKGFKIVPASSSSSNAPPK